MDSSRNISPIPNEAGRPAGELEAATKSARRSDLGFAENTVEISMSYAFGLQPGDAEQQAGVQVQPEVVKPAETAEPAPTAKILEFPTRPNTVQNPLFGNQNNAEAEIIEFPGSTNEKPVEQQAEAQPLPASAELSEEDALALDARQKIAEALEEAKAKEDAAEAGRIVPFNPYDQKSAPYGQIKDAA